MFLFKRLYEEACSLLSRLNDPTIDECRKVKYQHMLTIYKDPEDENDDGYPYDNQMFILTEKGKAYRESGVIRP